MGVVRVLLAAGADVNAQSGAALTEASKYGRVGVVRVLMQERSISSWWAPPYKSYPKYQKNLWGGGLIAPMHEDLERRSEGSDVNSQLGDTLKEASEKGCVKSVLVLLAEGADVNAESGAALRKASRYGHVDVVRVLLTAGADVNAEYGAALRKASRYGHVDVVRVLLAAGADVNARFASDIRQASKYGHVGVNRVLLAARADRSCAALTEACKNGHVSVVRVLLAAGADVNSQSGAALRQAYKNGHVDVVRVLKEGSCMGRFRIASPCRIIRLLLVYTRGKLKVGQQKR